MQNRNGLDFCAIHSSMCSCDNEKHNSALSNVLHQAHKQCNDGKLISSGLVFETNNLQRENVRTGK